MNVLNSLPLIAQIKQYGRPENSNQLVRELKWLDAKESDPSLLNVGKLKGRNVNENSIYTTTTNKSKYPSFG